MAEHKKTHEEYAIKRMEWTSFEDANLHLQEAHRLKHLDHKNILRYHSVFLHKYSADTQFVCICFEYCPGGDLQKAITKAWSSSNGSQSFSSSPSSPSSPVHSAAANGGQQAIALNQQNQAQAYSQIHQQQRYMKEDDILRYMIEIGEGLAYLHDQNIAHRDLKPQNVLISKDGSLKIGDFGISREVGTSLVKTQCGTPNYMSWEMLNKEPYDETTDLYSLGIILLQLLTGKAPMMSVEMSKNPQFFQDLERESVRKYHYSPELIHLARKLVSLNPSERPSAREVIRTVKKIQANKRKSALTEFSDRLVLSRVYTRLDTKLKLHIFSFLDIVDMYYVALSCKSIFRIWDMYWWDQFVRTKKGAKMIEDLSSENTDFMVGSLGSTASSGTGSSSSGTIGSGGGGVNSGNYGSSGGGGGSGSSSGNSNVMHLSVVTSGGSGRSRRGSTIDSPTTMSNSSGGSIDIDKMKAKDQIFMYCKISRPQRKRARRNMGKRIVSEIHPSQINDAAEFLAKRFRISPSEWAEYVFGLSPSPPQDEHVTIQLHATPPPPSTLTQSKANTTPTHTNNTNTTTNNNTNTDANTHNTNNVNTTNGSDVAISLENSSALGPKIDSEPDTEVIDLNVAPTDSNLRNSVIDENVHQEMSTDTSIGTMNSGGSTFSSHESNTQNNSGGSGASGCTKQAYNVSSSKFLQMKWFFTCAIRYGIKYGRVWVSTFYYNKLFVREIQGISIWLHPYNYRNISLWKMLRVGGGYGPQNMGINTFRRVLKTIDASEKIHSKVLDQKVKPHWTLFLLAVKPGMTKNGIGSSLILPVLKSADEQSIPIYATVYSPTIDLLQFYRRHGFDVVEKVEKPSVGPPFYSMIRYSQ